MLDANSLRAWFDRALPYRQYVATGTPDQQQSWNAFEEHSRQSAPISPEQKQLLASFARRLNVLVLSGTWCGDCVHQCPLFFQIAECNPAAGSDGSIDLRFLDRDEASDLSAACSICGGRRVPTVLFLNEEFEFTALFGDRSLSRYRALAARKLGASCPLPGAPVPPDEVAATRQDWIDEFERVHLLLRLSPKLRQKHGD